jgi:hypothetical protein
MFSQLRPAAAVRRRRTNRPFLVSLALLVGVLAACSGQPGPTTQPTTGGPVGTGPTPQPTAWPASVVSSMIALGAADGQFVQMGNDLQTAVDAGNLQELLTVTNDAKTFLTGNQANIPRLQAYALTKPLGDSLAAAYGQMIAGVTQIHDSLVNGDASGVTTGFQTFLAGNTAYAAVRQELGDKAQQAIFMKRIYYQ